LSFFAFSFSKKKVWQIKGEKEKINFLSENKEIEKRGLFSGLPCSFPKKRAFAVVLAEYPQTMPLSGVSFADLVIEGPVASPMGITRLIAFFQCQRPKEIGSIRSARPYMVDLALGFDSIFVSWGGCKAAISKIKKLSLDWLDGRVNVAGAFFRKTYIPAPHNGFSRFDGMEKASEILGFRKETNFEGFKFSEKISGFEFKKGEKEIFIDYFYPVKYVYDEKRKVYLRYWRGERMEDLLGGEVFAKNLILMKTKMGILSRGVVDVDVIGKGEARIYIEGKMIEGYWKKESERSKLSFFDKKGKEIQFKPGPIWIEIVNKF